MKLYKLIGHSQYPLWNNNGTKIVYHIKYNEFFLLLKYKSSLENTILYQNKILSLFIRKQNFDKYFEEIK